MSTPSNAVAESPPDGQAAAPAAMSATRPLYWSIRRELWENHSIYIAPLVVAAVVLLGFLIGAIFMPASMRDVSMLDPAQQGAALVKRYLATVMPLLLTGFLVAVFYCLDALHSERRDRSILFWKSLPVSDFTTVLSKAIIVLVVLPLVTFAVIVALQLIILLLSTPITLLKGLSVAPLWTRLPVLRMWLLAFYGLAVLALWHAPIYGWLLLVSGWARRATFLWALLPPLAVGVVERIGFGTWHFASLLKSRVFGDFGGAFNPHDIAADGLPGLEPLNFLSSPGLWIGLAVAAAFFAAAARLRRYREPI
jgi:ABC-2 type transport system permease protein